MKNLPYFKTSILIKNLINWINENFTLRILTHQIQKY
jgi:hypothetical protein